MFSERRSKEFWFASHRQTTAKPRPEPPQRAACQSINKKNGSRCGLGSRQTLF
jgi:hypothetical protein